MALVGASTQKRMDRQLRTLEQLAVISLTWWRAFRR